MKNYLGKEGLLARELLDFESREGQMLLAKGVEDAINTGQSLIAEAGTGIGKTYAYLIPGLLTQRKVIVSTGTKHLQDQLYFRDLPRIKKILQSKRKTSLLKGRSNYLCHYRLDSFRHDISFNTQDSALLEEVYQWSRQTKDGDVAAIKSMMPNNQFVSLITSTIDNCLGSSCPFYRDCFLVKARKEAQEADLVVVNHHLLFADMAIKQDGFGEVLPATDVIIVDEAHKLPKVASQFLSTTLTSRQLMLLSEDCIKEAKKETAVYHAIASVIEDFSKSISLWLRYLRLSPQKSTIQALVQDHKINAQALVIIKTIEQLIKTLKEFSHVSEGLESCLSRSQEYFKRLNVFFGDGLQDEQVLSYEKQDKHIAMKATPLMLGEAMNNYRANIHANWIFTSATLTVDNQFDHFQQQLGFDGCSTLQIDSPFDYKKQALCYLPSHLVLPSHPQYIKKLVEQCIPVLEKTKGRALFLFTSHRATKEAQELLIKTDFQLFIQGDESPIALIERFKSTPNAILLATAGFWDGVDIPGNALSCLIIDKLPFAPPDDPVLKARSKVVEQTGEKPFFKIQLPEAILALKQGVGRLIRTQSDRGILILGDPRIKSKGYGKMVIDSLPEMPKTNDFNVVDSFISHENFSS